MSCRGFLANYTPRRGKSRNQLFSIQIDRSRCDLSNEEIYDSLRDILNKYRSTHDDTLFIMLPEGITFRRI